MRIQLEKDIIKIKMFPLNKNWIFMCNYYYIWFDFPFI